MKFGFFASLPSISFGESREFVAVAVYLQSAKHTVHRHKLESESELDFSDKQSRTIARLTD